MDISLILFSRKKENTLMVYKFIYYKNYIYDMIFWDPMLKMDE